MTDETIRLVVTVAAGVTLILLAGRIRKARSRPSASLNELAAQIPTFKVVTLGMHGSGKTILLASMYRCIQTPGDRGFYFKAPHQQVIELGSWFQHVADPTDAWPEGTRKQGDDPPHGHRLVVVWTDHRVSGSDLSAADSSDITEDPVDEHSRPLRLLHGFVATGGQLLGAASADLERTRAIALDTYRRFIADEENFTVESSSPVPITPPAPPKSPADTAVSPVHSARSFPAGKSLLAIGLLAILVVLGIQLFGTGPDAQSFTGTAPEVHDLQLDESVVAIRFTEVDVDKAARIELVMGAEQPRSVRLVEDGRYALDQAQPYKLRVSGAGTYDFSVEPVP